jgi:hypothetical protein
MVVGAPIGNHRRLCWRLVFILSLGFSAISSWCAAAQTSREYDLKAVLLFNLTQFVEWPVSAFAQPDVPVVIGIVGRDPFGSVLDDIVRDEKCDGHSIVVRRYRNAQAAVRDAHILFVSSSEADDLPNVLRFLRGRPILSVADIDRFAQRGGMIEFTTNSQGKIHPRINLAATKEAELVVSAKLLRLAEVVAPAGN